MATQKEVVVRVIEAVEPPAPLTARPRVSSLHDNLQAFLNANNPVGFPPLDTASLDMEKIGDLFVLVAMERELSTDDFKHHAWQVKKLSGGAIKVTSAYDLMAIIFGYRNYRDHARIDLEQHGKIFNRRDASQVANEVFGTRG